MKWNLLPLVAIALGLIIYAAIRGDGAVSDGFRAASLGFLKFLPVLAIVFLIVGFVEVLVPSEVIKHHLSDASGWRGLGIGWLAGMLTPGGSLIGMPLVANLFKSGVGPSILITYLTSLAVLSFLRTPMEIAFYGWRLTLLRVAVSIVLPIMAGVLAKLLAPWILGETPV